MPRSLVAWGLVSALAFAAAAGLVAERSTRGFDRDITIALQSVASYPLDVLANVNTVFGQASVTLALAAAAALALWRWGPPLAWLAPALIGLTLAVGVGLKLVLDHPGPTAEFHRAFWNPLGVPSSATPFAFPSGHVSRTAFLVVLLVGVVRVAWIRIAALVLLAYTVWARVYIGDHWISDAVGGLALGVFAGALALGWIWWCRSRARRT